MQNIYTFGIQLFADAQSADAGEVNVSENTDECENTKEVADKSVTADNTEENTESGEKSHGSDNLNAIKSVGDTLVALRKSSLAKLHTQRWEQEALEIKDTYPDFDLGREIKNPEFSSLLKAGISLRRAYEAVHLESIIGEAMRYSAVVAGKKAAEALSRKGNRPQENSVLDRASSLTHRDVASLTEGDIMRILTEVGKGAKITF